MKTFQAKPSDVARKWFLIDASDATLGRISTLAAELLLGKKKPSFTSHIDTGDFVVIVNSDKLVVTGDKLNQKTYYRHSSYPGGIRATSLQEQLDKDSTVVIEKSIYGMLPTNKLRPERMKRLKVYRDENHKHSAQTPEKVEIGGSK